MAKFCWIIFGFIVTTCRAQFGFQQLLRSPSTFRKSADVLLRTIGINLEDHQCFTLARRPFFMNGIVQLPCNRLTPDMPVIRSYMGPFGPICVSYVRERGFKYYQVPLCCPGFMRDPASGRCALRTGDVPRKLELLQQRVDMVKMVASQMLKAMWTKARQDMARKRVMILARIQETQQQILSGMLRMPNMLPEMTPTPRNCPMMSLMTRMVLQTPAMQRIMTNMHQIMHRMPVVSRLPVIPRIPIMPRTPTMELMNMLPMIIRRPPISPMFTIYNMIHEPQSGMDILKFRTPSHTSVQLQSEMNFLKFKTPSHTLGPHVVYQPPLRESYVNLKVAQTNNPFIFRSNILAQPRPEIMMTTTTRSMSLIPRLVLSDHDNLLPVKQIQEFHHSKPSLSQVPRNEHNLSDVHSTEFPIIYNSLNENNVRKQDVLQSKSLLQGESGQHHDNVPSDGFHEAPSQEHNKADTVLHTDTSDKASVMPVLRMEHVPDFIVESCVARLDATVKTCLTQQNIDVPDVMSAFEPFNDEKSRLLCRTKDDIFNCITDSLNNCNNTTDADLANETHMETVQRIKNMCDLRELFVHGNNTNEQDANDTNGADTVATVENVDALPIDIQGLPTTSSNDEFASVDKVGVPKTPAKQIKEAIHREIHVQELNMKGYQMQIVIGFCVGGLILLIVITIIICCCCKCKLKKKMKIIKEMEKSTYSLKDNIYSTGISPSVFDVHSIPAMYYEEAKGEKISSKDPAVVLKDGDNI